MVHFSQTKNGLLPPIIPIIPLDGVVLLPHGDLPLRISESRYKALVDEVLCSYGLVGIVQPCAFLRKDRQDSPIGCAGRITAFEETSDGQYHINLHGTSRFKIMGTILPETKRYITANVRWEDFKEDEAEGRDCLGGKREYLAALLGPYLERQNMWVDLHLIENIGDDTLVTALATICPLSAPEKQALLEAPCLEKRADLLLRLLEISLRAYTPSHEKLH